MTKNKKAFRISVALIISIVMMLTFIPLTAISAPVQLETPTIFTQTQTSTTGALTQTWQEYRAIIFETDPNASGLNVFVFDNLADANAATAATAESLAIAVARDVSRTDHSMSIGGTTHVRPPVLEENQGLIDVRLLQFEELNDSGATRVLPADFTPGGIADSYFAGGCDGSCRGVPEGMTGDRPNAHTATSECLVPGFTQGDTTNLRPGSFWFRIQAVPADPATHSPSELGGRLVDDAIVGIGPYSISMGPSEVRKVIEDWITAHLAANPNATYEQILEALSDPQSSLRLIDLRGPAEFRDEGNPRFFAERITNATINTADDEALAELFPNKEAQILVF